MKPAKPRMIAAGKSNGVETMVSQAEGEQPGKRKWSVINLRKQEVHYTLPSGEVVIVSPHKKRGLVPLITLPHGTTVKIVKIEGQIKPIDDGGKNVDTK